MESSRLKKIAILILLLLNAFLALLLWQQNRQSRQAAEETAEQLHALFAGEGMRFSDQADLLSQALSPRLLSRSQEVESRIAAQLLGGSPVSASQGGGIYSYDGDGGTLQFRSGGSFDGGHLSVPVAAPEQFFRDFCSRFGYRDIVWDESGTASAVQYVEGVLVAGCEITFRFADGMLIAVTGAHVSVDGAAAEGTEVLSCASALCRFLDYRRLSGIVCSTVEDVRCVYRLSSASSALRLEPVWQVDTDTNAYYVDGFTGEVSW